MRSDSNHERKKTVYDVIDAKKKGEKLVVLTAYDFSMASIIDKSGVDIILVGDSAGMVMLGYKDTRPVRMSEMLLFSKGVSTATYRAMVTVDMPFGSYHGSINKTISNAVKLVKAGSDSVKIEGGKEICDRINGLVKVGIPVMGHIGYKPQTSDMWNFTRAAGKTKESAFKLLNEAKAIEQAGAFSIVLEMVTAEVAEIITKNLSIPTIGIGSGCSCDGQVLVSYDLLGIYQKMKPRFVKKYLDLDHSITDSVQAYSRDVKSGLFPSDENTIHMDPREYDGFLKQCGVRIR
jgi:3-methyl-2-oxobutanoate hydroxymethyltransferase